MFMQAFLNCGIDGGTLTEWKEMKSAAPLCPKSNPDSHTYNMIIVLKVSYPQFLMLKAVTILFIQCGILINILKCCY